MLNGRSLYNVGKRTGEVNNESASITITLSEQTYQRVQKRATERNRSVEDELEQVVEAALSEAEKEETSLAEIDQELEQLVFLDDNQLWQAARLTVPAAKSDKVERLLQKYKQEGLTANEQDELTHLQQFEHRIMLVRAEAAILLQERGFQPLQ